jgi:hypothetical protein
MFQKEEEQKEMANLAVEILIREVSVRGVIVGTKTHFEELNRAIEASKIVPVVDQVRLPFFFPLAVFFPLVRFPTSLLPLTLSCLLPQVFSFDQTKEAYRTAQKGAFGKIVVELA